MMRLRLERWILACGVAAALQGCSRGPGEPFRGDVTLTTTAQAYRPGAPLTAIVSNRTTRILHVDACLRRIERLVDSQWNPVAYEPVCLDVRYSLPRGTDQALDLVVPPSLEPGTYRIWIDTLPNGFRAVLHVGSTPFTVLPAAADAVP